ncbi:MAG: hypothetical protein JRD47_03635, partial [Deltaproteobacteria bacterium]|nr:hypothetical protein [Deltaproteobacteria bacterium]
VSQSPRLLGLFQKRIDGDDALLDLARVRFNEMGLGAEFYAKTTEELDHLLKFRPAAETLLVAHLRRGINLLEKKDLSLVIDFAERFKGRLFGFVVHDQPEISTRFDDYLSALNRLEVEYNKIQGSPYLFIEYAVGLAPSLFVHFAETMKGLQRISCCIDIGHIGLWQARTAYSKEHPGKDVCSLTTDDSSLPEVIEDVQSAVRSALDTVLSIVRVLGRLEKPLHFHLHDGHPLSITSPFGISDHLSFLDKIPVPFEYKGKRSLDPMFGPSGLSSIVSESLKHLGPEQVSFSLEIHPAQGRLPLEDASYLFDHWEEKTNAERMNHWLWVLSQNQQLVQNSLEGK